MVWYKFGCAQKKRPGANPGQHLRSGASLRSQVAGGNNRTRSAPTRVVFLACLQTSGAGRPHEPSVTRLRGGALKFYVCSVPKQTPHFALAADHKSRREPPGWYVRAGRYSGSGFCIPHDATHRGGHLFALSVRAGNLPTPYGPRRNNTACLLSTPPHILAFHPGIEPGISAFAGPRSIR